MKASETPEEHLRTIRALMERSTIYRAISAPAALIGGILGILAGAFLWWIGGSSPEGPGWHVFVFTWVSGYVIVEGINFTMICRNARNRGEKFLSPGLRHAVRSLAPPLLCGCATGVSLAAFLGDPGLCAIVWVIFFGLALLSTSSFAPRSITWLGRAFAIAGVLMLPLYFSLPDPEANKFQIASLIMASTFGLFHLIYAAAITGVHAVRFDRLDRQTSPPSPAAQPSLAE